MNNIHGLGSARDRAAGNQPGGGGGGSSPGVMDQLKSGWASIPLFNKGLLVFCTALYLISWVTPILNFYMMLVPSFILKFQGKLRKISSHAFK